MRGVGGRIAKEKGLGFHAPENQEKRKAGNVAGGSKNRDLRVGMFSPAAIAEVKELRLGLYDKDVPAYGLHVRWHVNRGKTKPTCEFCCSDEAPQFRRKARDKR